MSSYNTAGATSVPDDRYKILFSEMTDGFALFAVQRDTLGAITDFKIVEVNSAMEKICHLMAEQVTGKCLLSVLPHNGPFLKTIFEHVLQTGIPETFERYIQDIDSHLNISVYRPLPDLLACVVVDVSYRKQIEEALRESEATFRAHVENSFDVIFTLNSAGEFVFVSPAWERHFGYPASDVMGKPFAPQVHPDDIQPCVEYLTRILSTGTSGTSPVYRVKCADGSLRSFVANGRPYIDTKGELLFLGVGHDVTDQLQAEQERLEFERQLLHTQKLESLGILAGGIAHDFNNLLLAVQGNIEMATMQLSSAEAAEKYLKQALRAAHHAAELTNRLLAYSGKGNFLLKRFNLNELVNDNAPLLRTAVPRTITIESTLADSLPEIMGDVAQIQQIVMNLITNAAEAIDTPAGTIMITTGTKQYNASELAESRLETKPDPGLYVFIEVQDTGCGMCPEVLEKIFDPFFTTKFTGRGLGMSAVLGIVKAHTGAMFLASTPGSGTTIRVIFPASTAVTATSQPASREQNLTSFSASQAGGTVLVVDDEKSVLRICSAMVKQSGFTVMTATDGAEALELFRQHRNDIDLVLMDLTMPNMDGVTTMKALREISPEIKIILSSGYNEQELDERVIGQQPTAFIRKPYRLQALATELQQALQS